MPRIESENWVDRTWSFGLPSRLLPNVVERLRGTPVRAAALLGGVDDAAASSRVGSRWSAKENIGHLDDLHELDTVRLAEYVSGADVLTAADMANSRTEAAGHNDKSSRELLERFERHRAELVAKLEVLSVEIVESTSHHSRLGQRLRLIDWLFFVAEHDDHHLVRARQVLGSVPGPRNAR